MLLKVVGIRRVPSISSKRRNELRDYNGISINQAAPEICPRLR